MKKNSQSSWIGGTSLMVILSVICLTVFAVLCLSTALSELRLSNASAAAATAYYEADTHAEEIFAALRKGSIPDSVSRDGNAYRYQVPVSQHLSLQITLVKTDGSWKVLQWNTFLSSDPQTEQVLSLWDGNPIQEETP